jgi:hypothetical protein
MLELGKVVHHNINRVVYGCVLIRYTSKMQLCTFYYICWAVDCVPETLNVYAER